MDINTNKTPLATEVPIEVENAARVFAMGLPAYKGLVDGLSLKSSKRLNKAIVEYPLHDEKQPLIQQSEQRVFELGIQLMEARSIMIEYSVKEQHKKQLEQAEKEKGETNGKE